MSAENPELSEWVGLDDDYALETAMTELEREQRGNAFKSLREKLQALKQSKNGSLFFRTYVPDAFSRNALIIWHPATARRPNSVRVIVSDEKSSVVDISRRIIESREYVYRPLGNLVAAKTCSVPVPEQGSWKLDYGEFMLQRPDDDPVAYVFHGLGYNQNLLCDSPGADLSQLTARRMTAESLGSVLDSLPAHEAVPSHYLFSLVTS